MGHFTTPRWAQGHVLLGCTLGLWACASSAPPPSQGMTFRGRGPLPRYREAEHLGAPYTFDTLIGIRQLEDDATWKPLDDQLEIGISVQTPVQRRSFRDDAGSRLVEALAWDFNLRYAFDDSETTVGGDVVTRLSSRTVEVGGGLVLSPFRDRASIEPYLGLGGAFVFTDTDLNRSGTVMSDRDTVFTPYIRAGARVPLDGRQHFGFDVRWLSNADASIDGIGADVGALSISLLFGARF